LRGVVDSMMIVKANLKQIADKMAQMNADGGGTRLAQEYNLSDEQEATSIFTLVNSTANELEAQSPFYNQMISRLG
jgi:hypothetical protein